MCKSNCPPKLTTGCASFSGNNCNQLSSITGDQSLKSLWKNFSPLVFAELLSFSHTGWLSSINCCLRSCQGITMGFKSALWLGQSKTLILFLLSYSKVDVFWIIVLLYNPIAFKLQIIDWWPDILRHDFLVESRLHGSSSEASHTVTLSPPPCLTVGKVYLLWNAVVALCQL